MIELNNVTLVCASSVKIEESIKAFEYSYKYISFGKKMFFTHLDVENGVKIKKIDNIFKYNAFILKELNSYINTNFAMIVQWDGFPVNVEKWSDEFLEYDYIGAPWPWNGGVGNGGFSLRSKKLLTACEEMFKDYPEEITEPEDHLICNTFRNIYSEQYGIKFAPIDVAYRFSTENGDYNQHKSFGFHDWRANNPYNLKTTIVKQK